MRRAGHEVTVVCAGDGHRRTRVEEGGVRVHRLPGRGLFYSGGAPEALTRMRGWFAAMRFAAELGLRAAVHLRHADALITNWLVPCSVFGCLIAGGRPHVAVAHSGDVHLLERLGIGAVRAVAGLLARRARVAFASTRLRERFLFDVLPEDRDRLVARSAVVPMGIDVADLRPRAPRAHLRGRLVVAFVGRRSPIKGLPVLERAVSEVPGVTLRVADGGVTGEGKRRLLEAADVLVVPSLELDDGRTEGTPTVIFEGMAAGLPVVASRTGGIPDVVRDGETGLLVPPGDARELGRALGRLRDDVDLRVRLGNEAAREAGAHDWARVGPALAALL